MTSSLADPYPLYEAIRSTTPQYLAPLGLWTVTAFDLAATVLADPRCSVVSPRQWQATDDHDGVHAALDAELSTQLMYTRGLEHDAARRMALRALMPGYLSREADTIRQLAVKAMDTSLRPGIDLMAEVAENVPKAVALQMLGVPERDRAAVAAWAHPIARAVDWLMTTEDAGRTVAALRDARAYFAGLARERRRQPGSDVLSVLLEARDATGSAPSDDDLGVFSVQLLGSYETTKALIGNLTVALSRHPAQLDLVHHNPDLVPACVEEGLRYDPPVQVTSRHVEADLSWAGTSIPAGSDVAVILGAANRDPEVYSRPDELWIERGERRHLAFGHGAHSCVGNRVARIVATTVVGRIVALRGLTADTDALRWKSSLVIRCPDVLSIDWDVRSSVGT